MAKFGPHNRLDKLDDLLSKKTSPQEVRAIKEQWNEWEEWTQEQKMILVLNKSKATVCSKRRWMADWGWRGA